VKGFAADTMHMARLMDAARQSYSLESLTDEMLNKRKVPMKERFSVPKITASGTESKIKVLPLIENIQRGEKRDDFIDYSCFDAESTYYLREHLQKRLVAMNWSDDQTLFDFYNLYWRPFGEMLVDMERAGIYIRKSNYLPELEKRAEKDMENATKNFLDWAAKFHPDHQYMNINSTAQKRQLFFGEKDSLEEFDRENFENYIEEGKKNPLKYRKFTIKGVGIKPLSKTSTKEAQVSLAVLKQLSGKHVFSDNHQYGCVRLFQ